MITKEEKTALEKALNRSLWIALTCFFLTISISGCSQVIDSTYRFNEAQIREILKIAYELEACENSLNDMGMIVNECQDKVNDLVKINKDLILINEKKTIKFNRFRNFTFSFAVLGTFFYLIK